jgi:Ca-activated chloride channel homolog
MEITFSDPIFLWFLAGIPILIVIHFWSLNRTRLNALKFSNFEAISRIVGGKQDLSKNVGLLVMESVSLLFIVLAMSGVNVWYEGYGSDTDFVIALDTSSSMTTEDISPDRISAAKQAAMKFVDISPPGSEIGLVTFSGSPVVIQQLAENRITTKKNIDDVFVSVTGGTNIGDAIISSVNTLIASNSSRAVILLTDGQSNIGPSLDEAIKYAKSYGVIIHTIGIGDEAGGVLKGTSVVLGLNEQDLVKIAMETNGQYFRAKSKEALDFSYNEIAYLNKQKMRRDLSFILIFGVFVILLIEWFLINTKYRTIP